MSAPTDGGAVFPRLTGLTTHDVGAAHTARFTAEYGGGNFGLSLRDYFAGQALVLCNRDASTMAEVCERRGIDVPTAVAKMAYEIADAMLAAREAKG